MRPFPLPHSALQRSVWALALLCLLPAGIAAQDTAQDVATAPPHITVVDGSATIERDGLAETATAGMPLVAGDRIQTTRGRVEVLFADGTALDIDEFASVELQSTTLLRLTSGRLMLVVAGVDNPANATRYQIDTPVASAFTDGPGEYRVAILNGGGSSETELAVFRGSATLSTETGSTSARAGERTLAREALAPSYPLPFNSARFDAFDRWAAARRDARLGTASRRYLPRDLYAYSGAFDQYGAWNYEGPYGYVWYPYVGPGWRPYHRGRWTALRTYGWTWIGHDPWGWPTHHYGRWGFARNRWFWIPGFHWGPAWVTWASAPGYVGWCPLGWDGRPVFALTVAAGNPWLGWVVVPRPYFGHRYVVHQYAVAAASIPARTSFVARSQPPVAPAVAVPRPRAIPRPSGQSPAQQSAGRAIPRDPAGRAQLNSRPSAVDGRQSTVASRQSTVDRRQSAGARRALTPDDPGAAPRYEPDTRSSLAGQRPAAVNRLPRAASPAAEPARAPAPPTEQRWYPPVTMRRSAPRSDAGVPRGGVSSAPGVPRSEPGVPRGPLMRSAPAPASPPSMTTPPMQRAPMAPPAIQRGAPSAAPRIAPPAAPATGARPSAAPRMAVPRSAPSMAPPPTAAPAQQPAPPAQESSPPAGARSPRNRSE